MPDLSYLDFLDSKFGESLPGGVATQEPPPKPEPRPELEPATGIAAKFLNSIPNPAWHDDSIPVEDRLQSIYRTKADAGWQNVKPVIERTFPGMDASKLEQFYHLEGARGRAAQHEETSGEYFRTHMLADVGLGRFNDAREYKAARDRFDKGEASQKDAAVIAGFEENQKREAAKSTGEAVLDTVAGLPAFGAEMLAGGRVLRAVGAGASAAALPTFALRNAARTAVMPRFYLPGAAENAIEKGGDWYDPKNLGRSVALGNLQMAVLGQVQSMAGNTAGLVPRVAAKAGIGIAEQQAADAVAGATGLQTRYGAVQDFLEGKNGEGWKKVATQATMFGAFALAHGAKATEVPEAFRDIANDLKKQGMSDKGAMDVIGKVQDAVEAAQKTGEKPEFKGIPAAAKRYGETLNNMMKPERFKPAEPNISEGGTRLMPTEAEVKQTEAAFPDEAQAFHDAIRRHKEAKDTRSQDLPAAEQELARATEAYKAAMAGKRPGVPATPEPPPQALEARPAAPEATPAEVPLGGERGVGGAGEAKLTPRQQAVLDGRAINPETGKPNKSFRELEAELGIKKTMIQKEEKAGLEIQNELQSRAKQADELAAQEAASRRGGQEAPRDVFGVKAAKKEPIPKEGFGREANLEAETKGDAADLFIQAQAKAEALKKVGKLTPELEKEHGEIASEITGATKSARRSGLSKRASSAALQRGYEAEKVREASGESVPAAGASGRIRGTDTGAGPVQGQGQGAGLRGATGGPGQPARAEGVQGAVGRSGEPAAADRIPGAGGGAESGLPSAGGGPGRVPGPGDKGEGAAGLASRIIETGANAEAELAKRIKDFKLTSGVDPEIAKLLVQAVAGRIVKGGYDFAKWSKSAIEQFGEKIKPHIQAIWDSAVKMAKGEPEQEPVGIKNASVDAELAKEGLPPTEHGPSTTQEAEMAKAKQVIESDPEAGRRLVESLNAKPRTISKEEVALLTLETNRRKLARNAAEEKIFDAKTDVEIAEARIAQAKARDDYAELGNAVTKAGTEQAQAFQLRQAMVKADFSLAQLERSRMAAMKEGKGRKLTDAEEAKVTADVSADVAKMAALEARIKELEKNQVVSQPKRTARAEKADRAAEEAMQKFMELAKGKLFSTPFDPQITKALIDVARTQIARGTARLVDFIDTMRQRVGKPLTKEFEGALETAWDAAHKMEGKKTPEKMTPEEREKNRLTREIDKIKSGQKGPVEPREKAQETPEIAKLRGELEKLRRDQHEKDLRAAAEARPTYQKVLGIAAKWYRGSILSSPITLAKLTSAAVERMAFAPIQNLVGAGFGKVFPKIYGKAVYEGKTSIGLEARAFAEGWKRLAEDARSVMKTGNMDIGHRYGGEHFDVDPSLMDYIGRVHGALKTVPKRAAFYRALEQGTNAAVKAGLDVTDPAVQMRLGVEAYKMGERSIFMQENWISQKWRDFLKPVVDPKTGQETFTSAAARFVGKMTFPIVRIPTNIVLETLNHAFGSGIAPMRAAYATMKGISKLSPEQADSIMRQFKQGLTGAAMMALGYYLSDDVGGFYDPKEKRKGDEPRFGEVKLFGYRIPSYLIHNPLLECIQIGATIRRASDKTVKGERQGEGVGTAKALLGLLEEVPFVRETVNVAAAAEGRFGYVAGSKLKSLLVPQFLQWLGGNLDKDIPFNPFDDPRDREAKGALGQIKKGIPVVRESLPRK